MKKSYSQLIKQIEKLKLEAEKARQIEIQDVVKRIRDAIDHYGLTAQDLGLNAGLPTSAKAAKAATAKTPAAKKTRRSKGTNAAFPTAVVKFRDESGHSWGGRGKRPQWLRDALAAGKQLQDFLVKP